ncbi:NAD(P)H-binding protein [Streptomyces sp. NPDC048436]|uniref:NmrA family NAD(P)-binding protein n=1 Tax=Streptomyces sp. NPDC048436 TaxID=3365550 RepID=UPI003719D1CD
MSIVVTTPTGHVGTRVVRLLLQAGARPRVIVRDPARLEAATRDAVDIRQGDLADADFVREATEGARTVFWVDPTPHSDAEPVEASREIGAGYARAMRANGIARAVLLSSVGAEKRNGVGHIDGLARIEEQLDATGADVLHLRCGYFFTNLMLSLDDLARGVLTSNAAPRAAMPWVDPRDIGDVAAARLLSDSWQGRVVQAVHGPEDLTHRRVTEILSGVLGYPVRPETVDDDDVRDALRSAGLPPGAVEGIVGMTAGSRDLVPEQSRDLTTTTPTTLGSWAYEHLRPKLLAAVDEPTV